MPNGDPAEPHAPDVQFDGCILLPPVSEPGAFHTPGIDEDKEIAFFAVASLYKEEMDLKLQAGTDKLLERMAKNASASSENGYCGHALGHSPSRCYNACLGRL